MNVRPPDPETESRKAVAEKFNDCAFCGYLAGTLPCAFVKRTDAVASFVNLRQYERGALLVVPTRHASTVLDLPSDIVGLVHTEAAILGRALTHAFGATGLNIFQNNGIDAGQHIAHFHVHVVPRYPGSDPTLIYQQANFEPVPISEQAAIADSVREALRSI
jgi:histidine triad (HIT) family protein